MALNFYVDSLELWFIWLKKIYTIRTFFDRVFGNSPSQITLIWEAE